MLEVGDPAPRFSAMSTQEKQIDSTDYLGQYLVVYFYPKAFTTGCTAETKKFRDNYAEIKALGADVIGISIDDHATQCRFAHETGATFPLIADTDTKITHAFGVKWALFPAAKRVTFVIDPQGKIAARFHHEIQVLKHLDQVLKFIEKKTAKASA